MALYRSSPPTRFRVLSIHLIGEDPPREMFGYARTVAVGYLETGRIKPGMDVGAGVDADGRLRVVQAIATFARLVEEASAGREPIQVGLFWRGHLRLEPGQVLQEPSRGGGQA
jgi:translation elongation factor EF-Tu-like GTPase